MKKILGISAFYHDSAASLVVDGKVIAAVQEERFSRKKHDPGFPSASIQFCLDYAGLELKDLDAIVFYDKPLLKFERLLETYYAFAPKGLISFIKAIPVWVQEKLFLKSLLRKELKHLGDFDPAKTKLLFTEHHLSHAASAFYASPFESATILTIDGVGEWSTASIALGEGRQLKIVREMHFPHSLGLLYSAFTYFLGFKVNSGEYKLMGLSPYGNEGEQTRKYEALIREHLVKINEDGSVWLDQDYFAYTTGLRMIHEKLWESLFGFSKRNDEDPIEQHHCDLALAIQRITEDVVIKMAAEAKRVTGAKNLCLAGGVALNCVANGKLQASGLFDAIYIQPAAGDAGGALGAALAASHLYFGEERHILNPDGMQGAYLGPEYSGDDILFMNKITQAVYAYYERFGDLADDIAKSLADGEVVGWFQGRSEFGPRALGNRSILGNGADAGMQELINARIKYREGFRPFAPAVLQEDMSTYFDLDCDSPYMLVVGNVRNAFRKPLPEGYKTMPMREKLNTPRSTFQSVTHVDYSARIQSVDHKTNPEFDMLLKAFKKITGHSVVVNTSFNVRGEPPVCSPYDAYRCFMATDMDCLVIGQYVYRKIEQLDNKNKEKWMHAFEAD